MATTQIDMGTLQCTQVVVQGEPLVLVNVQDQGEITTSVLLDYRAVQALVGFLTDYLVDMDELWYDDGD